MNPLSAWLYLRRNPGVVLGTGLFAAVMVFLSVTTLSIIQGFQSSAREPIEQLRHFTLVVSEEAGEPAKRQYQGIARHAGVQRLLDARLLNVRVETLFSQLQLQALAIPRAAHPVILHRVGNRLTAGRLPRNDRAEMALHERIARSHGWRLGDTVDGGFRLVGLLEGPTLLGLVSLEFVTSDRFPFGLTLQAHALVLPRPGQRRAVNRYLARQPGLSLYTYERARGLIERNTRGTVLVLQAIAAFLFLLAAVIFAIVYRVFLEDRQDELAVLAALGLPFSQIMRRLLSEAGVIGVSAWLLGAALGVAGLAVLQAGVFAPRGLAIPVAARGPLLLSGLLPVLALLVTWVTVRGVLRHLDPVALIDQRR